MKLVLMSLVLALAAPAVSGATQSPQQNGPSASAPAFVRLDGEFKGATGEAKSGSVVVVISLYAGPDDPAPLWTETQAVTLDNAGRYTVFAGATQLEGLPREMFAKNAAQWIGVALQGEPEQPRVRMVSVPYALSAGNADTLGGVPANDFVMTENLAERVKKALTGEELEAASKDGDPTTMGTSGRIAKFDATGLAANIVDSVMTEAGGNVGIGTTGPAALLHIANPAVANEWILGGTGVSAYAQIVFGQTGVAEGSYGEFIRFSNASAGAGTLIISNEGRPIVFSTQNNAPYSSDLVVASSGNVGIGTPAPAARLDVIAASGAVNQIEFGITGQSRAALYRDDANGLLVYSAIAASANKNIRFYTGGGGADERLTILGSSGNVGIGTANPTSKLHVTGTARVTGDMTVDGNIGAKYQDVAEWVETGEPLEVGTVVIVAVGEMDQVAPSQIAYDTRVAGAVSRQPGLILGVAGDSKSLIAQSGRVRIKVDATYGAIKAGDLLVTSPTAGHAMLSKPVKLGKEKFHRPGTLVGKALEGLAGGKGEILVLLTLQ